MAISVVSSPMGLPDWNGLIMILSTGFAELEQTNYDHTYWLDRLERTYYDHQFISSSLFHYLL